MDLPSNENGFTGVHKRPASLRHNRTSSDLSSSACDKDVASSECPSSNGLRAVNTVTGAIQNFLKWSSSPLSKEKKALSFDSLETAAELVCDSQRYIGSTESVFMEKRKSTGAVPSTPPPSRDLTPHEEASDPTPAAAGAASPPESPPAPSSRRESSGTPGSWREPDSLLPEGLGSGVSGSSLAGSPRKSTDSSDSQRGGTDPHMDLQEKSFEKSLNNILNKCSETSLDLNIDSSSKGEESKLGKADRKKKSTPWYTMLSPTYKSRSEDFKRQFKDIPQDERLIVDYSCALQKEILVHGRMFVTQNWICFYANIFRWETVVTIPTKEILAITKEKTARVIPNAIQISTERERSFFTSFTARDKTFMMLFRLWQNALMEQPLAPQELWNWVHSSYGDELGLTSSDDDYVPPPSLSEGKDPNKDSSMVSKGDSSDLNMTSDLGRLNGEDDSLLQDDSGSVPLMMPGADNASQTDFSDTTEDDLSEGEIVCTEHDHFTRLGHNEVYHMPVDKLFELIFTDTEFFRNFTVARKLQDVTLTSWRDDPDENIGRVRDVSYTIPINAPFGPKSSHTNEKHVCYKQSQPGVLYVIDAECQPLGIPYADAFYVINRYCLTRVTKERCRLRVTSEVKYRKSVWGVVKNMIERNTMQGVLDYFQTLGIHLRRESDKMEKQGRSTVGKKKLRKRRPHGKKGRGTLTAESAGRQQSHPITADSLPAPPTPIRNMIAAQKEEKLLKMNAQTLVRIVCFMIVADTLIYGTLSANRVDPDETAPKGAVSSGSTLFANTSNHVTMSLVLLVMFNALLFYKLWSLETMADLFYLQHPHFTIDRFTSGVHVPESQEEWLELLQRQQELHDTEMTKWRTMIHGSLQLVDQMRQALQNLQDHIDTRNSDNKPP